MEEATGYALFEYMNSEMKPELPLEICDVICWTMRIVEDDGTIDEDFPALDRNRHIQKVRGGNIC